MPTKVAIPEDIEQVISALHAASRQAEELWAALREDRLVEYLSLTTDAEVLGRN
jgi:hypothetical protein